MESILFISNVQHDLEIKNVHCMYYKIFNRLRDLLQTFKLLKLTKKYLTNAYHLKRKYSSSISLVVLSLVLQEIVFVISHTIKIPPPLGSYWRESNVNLVTNESSCKCIDHPVLNVVLLFLNFSLITPFLMIQSHIYLPKN